MLFIFHYCKNHIRIDKSSEFESTIKNIYENISYILLLSTAVLVSFDFGFDEDFSGFYGEM